MPPKRPATSAFQPPGAAKTSSIARPKTKTTAPAKKQSTKRASAGSDLTRPRKKAATTRVESSSESSNNDDDDEEEDDASNLIDDEDASDNEDSSEEDASPAPIPRHRKDMDKTVDRNLSPPARSSKPSGNGNDTGDKLPPILPEKLLTTLLYSHFQRPETKINREARELAGRYVETFIREAVARAVVERRGSASGTAAPGGDFLEVEDLEKLAPQLILDF